MKDRVKKGAKLTRNLADPLPEKKDENGAFGGLKNGVFFCDFGGEKRVKIWAIFGVKGRPPAIPLLERVCEGC